MSFRLVCPTNPRHARFESTAHVQELWEVDKEGKFRKSIMALDVTHRPDSQDLYTCRECGAAARVEDYQP